MQESTTSGPTHELLLALAGRVDDDLLVWVRELVAVGEDTRAVEMVTAALAADRAALPGPLRADLVAVARTVRIDLDADAALAPAAPGGPDEYQHRFTATAPAAPTASPRPCAACRPACSTAATRSWSGA